MSLPPQKPFPSYKWRWLSVQPTEGLLVRPVYLGVLRALHQFEGQAYSSQELREVLHQVEVDTRSTVHLARDPHRNLFRNSGQYWRGTGLVEGTRGKILLSDLGRKVASSEITMTEFTDLIIRNTVLPNPRTYSRDEMECWNKAGLRIKPFMLILNTMASLGSVYSVEDGYLTPTELIKLVIPLAGTNATSIFIAKCIKDYRTGGLKIEQWPSCTPAANDKRLAREFLLFLANFNVCKQLSTEDGYSAKFVLDQSFFESFLEQTDDSFFEDGDLINNEITISKQSSLPSLIERKRVQTFTYARSGQSRFRKETLAASNNCCVLSGERLSEVLEAAHIIPVEFGGDDQVCNGFCLRADIHRLFDSGKMRIAPDGHISLNDAIEPTSLYHDLPKQIVIPEYVSKPNLEWRNLYI